MMKTMDTNSSHEERVPRRVVITGIGASLGAAGLSLSILAQGEAKQNANKKRRKKCKKRCKKDAKTCHQSCDLLPSGDRDTCKQECDIAKKACTKTC